MFGLTEASLVLRFVSAFSLLPLENSTDTCEKKASNDFVLYNENSCDLTDALRGFQGPPL